MVALIESAALVIGNESGPIHVAAALHRPLVTIIGPTSAVRTGPYNRPDHVARRELDCAPCYLKKLSQCPHHHTCLADLSAETVLAVCEQALNPVSDDAKVVT
jgi:ADP-heptose:LPS heptosyltransferase